jgi:hypothetical protein
MPKWEGVGRVGAVRRGGGVAGLERHGEGDEPDKRDPHVSEGHERRRVGRKAQLCGGSLFQRMCQGRSGGVAGREAAA